MCLAEQDLSRGFKRDFSRVNMAVLTERESEMMVTLDVSGGGEEKKKTTLICGGNAQGFFFLWHTGPSVYS